MPNVELSNAEIDVLAMDLEHSPDCIYSRVATGCYISEDGRAYEDEDMTVPYTPPTCTCGYFDLMYRARDKLRAARET